MAQWRPSLPVWITTDMCTRMEPDSDLWCSKGQGGSGSEERMIGEGAFLIFAQTVWTAALCAPQLCAFLGQMQATPIWFPTFEGGSSCAALWAVLNFRSSLVRAAESMEVSERGVESFGSYIVDRRSE